jgi:hypothetical protein
MQSKAVLAVLAATLLGACIIDVGQAAAEEPGFWAQYKARQTDAARLTQQGTAERMARITKFVTPKHLADCKSRAEEKGGASFFLTIKVVSPLVPHLGHSCLARNPWNKDEAMVVYIAAITNADGTRRGPGSDQLACKFELTNGVVSLTSVGIAPGKAPAGIPALCGFNNAPVARPAAQGTPSTPPASKESANASTPTAATSKGSSGEGRSGNCPSYMRNGDTCTDAAGRTCTRTPEGRKCS